MDKRTIVMRTPVDVANTIPVVLGYVPSESLVMLVTQGRQRFHARVDLPPGGEEGVATTPLIEACRSNGVTQVVLVMYAAEPWAWALMAKFVSHFVQAGIDVAATLRVGGRRVYGAPFDDEGEPWEITSTLAAEKVLEGIPIHRSREELAATVAYAPGETSPIEGDVLDPEIRDRFILGMRRESVEDLVRWQQALRATDDPARLPHVAALAALAAWLCGNGALAWICLDRSPERSSLGASVAALLESATPPAEWSAIQAFLSA